MPLPQPTFRWSATAVLGLAALLLLAEIAARLFFLNPATPQHFTAYGWVEAPGSRIVHSREGYSVSRLNSLGFYDDEPRDPPGTPRVLALGDSYGQARQLPRGQNFAFVAERALPGLEVVNAARAGRSPVHYAAYLPELHRRFQPNLSVLLVNDGDVNNLRHSGYVDLPADQALERFLNAEPGRVSARSGPAAWAQRAARSSALATWVYQRGTLLVNKEVGRLSAKWKPAPASAAPADPDLPAADAAADIDPAVGALLDGLHAHMTAVTPDLIYLYIPAIRYSSAGAEAQHPARRQFYADFAQRTGARVIDLTDAFLAEFARTGQPVHGFHNSIMGNGHINARGHALVGEALAHAAAERNQHPEARR